jgi:hypothetical protein
MEIQERENKTVVTVRAHRHPISGFAYVAWVGTAIFISSGLLQAVRRADPAGSPLLWALIVGNVALGVFALLLSLYQSVGREIFTVTREYLTHRYHLTPWLGYERRFDMTAVHNTRGVEPGSLFVAGTTPEQGRWGIRPGPFAFDYEGKTHRYGSRLTRAEAWQLVALVNAKRD